MAYIITKTNGDTLVTVPDTEKNTDYGLTLIGRNYSGYGVFLNDNFVSLLENFANRSAPTNPLTGQVWFSTTDNTLQVWTSTSWKKFAYTVVGTLAPAANTVSIGDFWWDSSNFQLKVWTGQTAFPRTATGISNGSTNVLTVNTTTGLAAGDSVTHAHISTIDYVVITQILSSNQLTISATPIVAIGDAITFTRGSGWYTVGPAYTRSQNITGAIPTTLTDINTVDHQVTLIYNNGKVGAVISNDLEFVPYAGDAIEGFATIRPGFQPKAFTQLLISKTVVTDANAATQSGGATGTVIEVNTTADLRTGDFYISDNVHYTSTATIQSIYANNSVFVSIPTIVSAGETVTFQRGTGVASLFQGTAYNSQRVQNLTADAFAQIGLSKNTFRGNIFVNGNITVGNTFSITRYTSGNIAIQNSQVSGNIDLLANVTGVSGNLAALRVEGATGLITVYADPTKPLGVVTKQYVDTINNTVVNQLKANVSTLIGTAPVGARDFGAVYNTTTTIIGNLGTTTTTLDTKAPIASPVFTGNPQAPTPALTDADTSIATTAYTYTIMSQLRSNVAANVATLTAAVNLRANIADPVFTGVPLAPTAVASVNSTQIATTAYVTRAVETLNVATTAVIVTKAPLLSANLTGIPTAPTASRLTNTTQIATTEFVQAVATNLDTTLTANAAVQDAQILLRAYIASPAFTGTPTAPTPTGQDSSSRIATTAFTMGEISRLNTSVQAILDLKSNTNSPIFTGDPRSISPAYPIEPADYTKIATAGLVEQVRRAVVANVDSGSDSIYAAIGLKADKASPVFTGTPLSVTPPAADNTTKIATTAFVQSELKALSYLAPKASPALTGIPTAPTPAAGDNSTKIATTEFIQTAITGTNTLWQGAHRYVSTSTPLAGQGIDGDVWFQV